MSSVQKLIEYFVQFPGIGPRQAKRFVYFLLSQNPEFITEFTKRIEELRGEMSQCSECFRYFPSGKRAMLICELCSDPNIETASIMVVEKDIDLENIKKSGTYRGRYFVLGGLVPVLDKEPEKRVRLRELDTKVHALGKQGLSEVILALSANPSGDYTSEFLRERLAPHVEKFNLKVTVLGRGLSTGTELEYSDAETLKHAFENRHSIL